MAEDESAKLWKVNRTIHELVKDRVCWTHYCAIWWPLIVRDTLKGFQVSDDEINMDPNTFKAHYANNSGSVE